MLKDKFPKRLIKEMFNRTSTNMTQMKQSLLDKVDISYISDSVHRKYFFFSKYSNIFSIFVE